MKHITCFKYIKIALFTVLCHATAQAQQMSTYTLYRDNWNILNPAIVSNNYLHYEYNMSFGASYRHQWTGLPEAPRNQALHFEFIPDGSNISTGGHILNDQTGEIGLTGIYGNFGYRLDFSRRTQQALMFGLSAGVVQYRANLTDVKFKDVSDTAANINDVQYFPDFGLGVFYHYSDVFYVGASVPQVFGLNTTYRGADGEFNVQRVPHFYGILGGYITLDLIGDGTSYLEPTVWFKYAPSSPMNIDVNVRYQFSDIAWLGLGGNLTKTFHAELGVVLGENIELLNNGQLKLGFGYDYAFTPYSQFFGSSFEANLVYSFAR